MNKQIAVIGLGRLGTSLAIILHDAGYEVLGIDKSIDLVEGITPNITHAVVADATRKEALQKLGISSFDMAVVTIGASIENSVMITILLKKLGVRYIVARADNELHGEILENIGADLAKGESIDLKAISRRAAQVAEKRVIERVLQQTRWNRKEAAERLQISYKALLYKMKENGLSEGR